MPQNITLTETNFAPQLFNRNSVEMVEPPSYEDATEIDPLMSTATNYDINVVIAAFDGISDVDDNPPRYEDLVSYQTFARTDIFTARSTYRTGKKRYICIVSVIVLFFVLLPTMFFKINNLVT